MIDTDRVISRTQTAAQEILARYHDATQQMLDAITTTTEKASADLSSTAHDAAEQIRQAGDSLAAEVKDRTEPTTEQVNAGVAELIDWVRRNSERVLADIDGFRTDLGSRLAPVTVVTKADLAALEARVVDAEKAAAKALKASKSRAGATKTPATKKPAAKKPAAKKA
ncbi:MAG: hypothetical protein ACXIVQ_02100 [Acidimicrobiales bacterium]